MRKNAYVLTAALLVAVGACMWLGYGALTAARDHRLAVENIHRDYTGMAARELAHISGEGVHWLIDEVLDERRGRRSSGYRDDYSSIVRRALDRADCECPAMNELLASFWVQGSRARVSGIGEGVSDWLTTQLMRRPETATHGLLISGSTSPFEGPVGIWYSSEGSRVGEPETVVGFVSSLTGVGEVVAHGYDDSWLLPPSPQRTLPDDSLFYVSVRTPEGALVFSSEGSHSTLGPAASVDTVDSDWGGFEVAVGIRPSKAQAATIGALPPPRTPLYLAMLGLVALLGVGGILQLRRELALGRLRDDFVSSASHELRTPLAQIRLFAHLQRNGGLRSDEQRRRAADVIDREARHLTHLIENILHFSGGRRAARVPRTLEVSGAVEDIVSGLQLLLDGNRVVLEKEFDSGLHVALADGTLEQMLTNLIDNAVKYGPEGQTLRITARRGPEGVVVAVEDQGPGVPPRDRDAVWRRYHRLDRDIEGPRAGTGVGLAVVADLAAENGGRAWVEDAPSGGARFAFTLPEVVPA